MRGGAMMSRNAKRGSFFDRLKAYYKAAEREAAKAAPFYVSDDGGLFANPQEVICSKNGRKQLKAFASLQRASSQAERDAQQPQAARAS